MKLTKLTYVLGIVLVLVISTGSTMAGDELTVTTDQAEQAYEYALEYVENEVAYLYGGRLNVEQYLDLLANGYVPGEDIGVDASALVVNAYRQIIPELKFWFDDTKTNTTLDATSKILYLYNCQPLSIEQIEPGDIIFFQNDDGNIIGTAIFSHVSGNVIHFITASSTAGKVVLTNAFLEGDYWLNTFAGFGRLQYPPQ